MDYAAVVEAGCAGIALISVPFGWMLRRSIGQLDKKIEAHDTAHQAHMKALADYKLHVAETYTTHSALEKAIDAINRSIDAVFAKLDRIEEKLDKKADK